jgi:hypothetical protein
MPIPIAGTPIMPIRMAGDGSTTPSVSPNTLFEGDRPGGTPSAQNANPMLPGGGSGTGSDTGYANGGSVGDPADDDTVYPTTAPKWDMLSPEAAMMGASVGYARGGPVQSNDLNRRAALLAGLRKRYDAMIAMAQGALAHRDENAAVRFAQRAHDMVPDGKHLILHLQPDGNVLAIVHDPRGGTQSQHVMTPDQFHHYLIGPATSFDHVIENGLGHNLRIASGRPQPRVPEHPADPIHKVRQVLQHTRQMYGVHKIGQAPPRIGYAAGGPVRGYYVGGDVDPGTEPLYDDTSIDPSLLAPGVRVPTEADYALSDQMQRRQAQQDAQDTPWQQLVRGYQAGEGERDASAPRISQDERDNPPLPEETPWEKFQRGYGYDASAPDPGTEPVPAELPPVDDRARTAGSLDDYMLSQQRGASSAPAQYTQNEPVTRESGMGELLSRAVPQLWEDYTRKQIPESEVTSIPKLWASAKQGLADYINGTNAAPPAAVEQALTDVAKRDPNGDTAKHVQDMIANQAPGGAGDPSTAGDSSGGAGFDVSDQAPSLNPQVAATARQAAVAAAADADKNKNPAEVSWADTARYTPRTGYFDKTPAGTVGRGGPQQRLIPNDPAVLPRNPSKEDLRPVGRNINGVPVNRNGEIIKPDGTLEYTPGYQSQQIVVDRNTGEVLPMTGGTGIPTRPREGTPGGTGVRGSLNRPFGFSAKDNAYQILSASGALDVVPSDKYGRSAEAQASEGARPWTQDMSRRPNAGEGPMPRGAPPMYVTERSAPYYDPNTGQVVTPPKQTMPSSGTPWQPAPNIRGAVGAPPTADDQSPAARAARAYPSAAQQPQRRDYQAILEREGEKDVLERAKLATRDTPEARMAREVVKQTGSNFRNLSNNQQKQYHTDMYSVVSDNNRFERAYEAVQRNAGESAAQFFKDYRNGVMSNPNYKPSDDELGAMSRAHDLVFGAPGATPSAPVTPKPVAPLPQGGAAPAAPAQQSPNSVLRVPPAQQNLPSRPSPPPPVPATLSSQAQWSPSRQQWRTPDGKLYDRNGRPVGP